MIYYIDETNEFIKDKETAEGAMNAGLGVTELDEDQLVEWLKRSWASRSEILKLVKNDLKEIERMCEAGINGGVNVKDAHFSMIHRTSSTLKNLISNHFEI